MSDIRTHGDDAADQATGSNNGRVQHNAAILALIDRDRAKPGTRVEAYHLGNDRLIGEALGELEHAREPTIARDEIALEPHRLLEPRDLFAKPLIVFSNAAQIDIAVPCGANADDHRVGPTLKR